MIDWDLAKDKSRSFKQSGVILYLLTLHYINRGHCLGFIKSNTGDKMTLCQAYSMSDYGRNEIVVYSRSYSGIISHQQERILTFIWLHLKMKQKTKNSPSVCMPKIIHKCYSLQGRFPSFQHAETHLHSSLYRDTPRFPARSWLKQLDKAHIKQQAEKIFF